MKYARLNDNGVEINALKGIVVETFETLGDITKMFHPSLRWFAATANVVPGFLFSGASYKDPNPPPVALDAAAELFHIRLLIAAAKVDILKREAILAELEVKEAALVKIVEGG